MRDTLLVIARTLDVNGLAFTVNTAGQTFAVDLYSTVTGFEALALDSSNNLSFNTASFSVSNALAASPEPSSLALLGTGVLGVVAILRRRTAA